MDAWKDFRGQRPALVTSRYFTAESRWFIFFFFVFMYFIYLSLFIVVIKIQRDSQQGSLRCLTLLYKKRVCIWFIVSFHIFIITVRANGIINHISPLCNYTRDRERSEKRYTIQKDNNLFKASALPSGFISHTFELSRRNKYLKFEIFLQAAWNSGGVTLSSSPLLSFWENGAYINLEPPAILTSIALYHKCIRTDWKHFENLKCKQSGDWLLQSPGPSGEYGLSVWSRSPSDEEYLTCKDVELQP